MHRASDRRGHADALARVVRRHRLLDQGVVSAPEKRLAQKGLEHAAFRSISGIDGRRRHAGFGSELADRDFVEAMRGKKPPGGSQDALPGQFRCGLASAGIVGPSLHACNIRYSSLHPIYQEGGFSMRWPIALALLVSSSTQAKEATMSDVSVEKHNKEVVRRIFEDSINSGKLELLNQLIAEDYVGQGAGPPSGRSAFAATMQALREGFPDIHYRLEDLVAEGDKVAVRWQWKGTHRGTFRGPAGVFAPTGKAVSNDGMAIFQLKEGKVVRSWLSTDRLGFLQEVGGLPKGPGAGAAAPKR